MNEQNIGGKDRENGDEKLMFALVVRFLCGSSGGAARGTRVNYSQIRGEQKTIFGIILMTIRAFPYNDSVGDHI